MRQYFSKHKWHLVVLVILLIIAGMSWHFGFKTQNTNNITQNPNDQNKNTSIPAPETEDNVGDASNKTQPQLIVTSYQLLVTTTSTAYDAMKNSQFDFQTKTFSGLGEFVEEIGGLKNDPQGGKYWIYYINGKSAKLGISTQIVVPGDLIEWKYGNTNF